MLRILILLLLLIACAVCSAQDDPSLTQEFGKLSAKERSRIAQREQEEALRDPEFQALMADAEKLFQKKLYDEALVIFKQARTKRPYNVHPKVKIHDLEVLIKKREEAETGSVKERPAPAPGMGAPTTTPPVLPAVVAEKTSEKEPAPTLDRKVAQPVKKPSEKRSAVVPEAVEKEPIAPVKKVQAPQLTPTTQPQYDILETNERIYREGGAIVIERVMPENGRSVVYRKVIRSWGEVYHFKNGSAITPHAWEEIFGTYR